MQIHLNRIGATDSGFLSFFEADLAVPFPVKRIYYIYEVPLNTKRGMHAHKKLRQALWCPMGHIDVMVDDGKTKAYYQLDSPEKLLIIGEGQWHEMYWRSEGAILCVAASDHYHEEDYIRDYAEFVRFVKEGYWSHES